MSIETIVILVQVFLLVFLGLKFYRKVIQKRVKLKP
jgi:hypothetical protein